MKFSIKQFLKVSVLLVLVLAAFGLGFHGSFCVLASDDVSSKIGAAEDALQRAFVAVSDAEDVGANVSDLLVQLDVAGRSLTEAEMTYKNGSSIEAVSKAERCFALANGVVDAALALKSSALIDRRRSEWQMFAFSVVGSFVLLIALVLVWVVFKRLYNRKLLGLRPEAGSDVEA